ncbi:hypothetical protein [Streptomyces sp. NPDC057257]|uniref:hypothetical protein n=1 Tax=Streptomyces sp. NPDC057257 TaxID=3346071 RepID=UPI003631F885
MSEQSGPPPTATTAGGFSLSSPTLHRRRRRVLQQLGLSVIVLVPWTVYLAVSLPDRFEARHWPMVWVGFDVMLLLSLAGAAVAVWLRRQALIPLSFVAATFLICDAWFDISLSWGKDDVWGSVASAVLVELPLALLLVLRARRVLKMSARLAWQRLGPGGEPPPLHRMPLFLTLAASRDDGAVTKGAEDDRRHGPTKKDGLPDGTRSALPRRARVPRRRSRPPSAPGGKTS